MTPAQLLTTIISYEGERTTFDKGLEKMWKQFGKEVRSVRKARKIRLSTFAASMGCTPAFISYLESGTRKWNSDMAKQAVKLLSA